MKIRSGFVSNSSSSSFVVCFPRKPESVDDVQEMLFGSNENYYPYNFKEVYTAKQVSETVWKDICTVGEATEEQVSDIFENMGDDYTTIEAFEFERMCEDRDDDRIPDFNTNSKKWSEWNRKYAMARRKAAVAEAKKWLLGKEDYCVYTFEFHDDTSYGSALEHGELFRRLIHKKVSNH
jgi:hypothetical protein